MIVIAGMFIVEAVTIIFIFYMNFAKLAVVVNICKRNY